MNESLVRSFCESPHRKLTVAIVSALTGLVVLFPLADDYFDKKESIRALVDELDSAQRLAKTLPTLEVRYAKLSEEVRELEARSVSEETVSRYRNELVSLIRKTECRMRQLDVSKPILRPWLAQDDPLSSQIAKAIKAKNKTVFTLERHTVSLTLDGSMQSVQDFLAQLHKSNSFTHSRRVDLNAAGQSGERVTLDLELWLFALSRHKNT